MAEENARERKYTKRLSLSVLLITTEGEKIGTGGNGKDDKQEAITLLYS